jgi:hypothetical protein
MRRVAGTFGALMLSAVSLLAVDGDKAMYVGGTLDGVFAKAEGKLATDPTAVHFDAKKDGAFEIPYASIAQLEYGQKAGRRVAVGVMVSPLALFSKKRNHYLTISYKDDRGADQAAVLELGKDIVRTTLKVLETRTGKTVEYQDDEARKSGVGGVAK